jgi:hypothetical protein
MAALEYMRAGLHVLALHHKQPNGRVHGEHWSWDDSFWGDVTSPEEMAVLDRAFSHDVGTTGIAILIPEGLLVADVDTDRAAALLKGLGWQATEDSIVAQTKNGLHVWFVAPGADRNRWLGDGREPDPNRTLLFKGFGGYVAAPPSLHFSTDGVQDGQYVWLDDSALVVGGIARWPDSLPVEAAKRFTVQDQMSAMKDGAVGVREQAASWEYVPVKGVPWHKWARVGTFNTVGLEQAIVNAADGNQNNCIHWAACVCRDEGVPFDVAMTRLLDAAIRGGHPKNRARDTIRSAYKRIARG